MAFLSVFNKIKYILNEQEQMGNKSNRGFWYWIWKYYSLSVLARKLHKNRNSIWIMHVEKKEGNVSWLHENIRNTAVLNFAVQTSQISPGTLFLLCSISHQISVTDDYDCKYFKFPWSLALYLQIKSHWFFHFPLDPLIYLEHYATNLRRKIKTK